MAGRGGGGTGHDGPHQSGTPSVMLLTDEIIIYFLSKLKEIMQLCFEES
jgi:hypothetical protein